MENFLQLHISEPGSGCDLVIYYSLHYHSFKSKFSSYYQLLRQLGNKFVHSETTYSIYDLRDWSLSVLMTAYKQPNPICWWFETTLMWANRLVGETTCYHLQVLIKISQIETRLIQRYFLSVILLSISNVKISKKMSFRPLDKSLSSAEKPTQGLRAPVLCKWAPLIRARFLQIPR